MVDLSSTLPDLTPAIGVAGFAGLALPDVPGGAVWKQAVIPGCVGCTKAPTGATPMHLCHYALTLDGTAAQIHDAQEYIINNSNTLNDWYRRAAKYVDVLNNTCHFVGISQQNEANTSQRFRYQLMGAGSNYVTLKWNGDPGTDPNNITFVYMYENPEWIPDVNQHYLSTTWTGKLPGRGWMTLSIPSCINSHAPWIIRSVSVSPTLAAEGTFTVYLETPIPSSAITLIPGTTPGSAITATLEFYVGAWNELPPCPRDVYPFWGTSATYSFDLPSVTLPTIAKRCRFHAWNSQWLSGRKRDANTGAWSAIEAAALFASMTIAYVDAAWQTTFIIAPEILDGFDQMELNVWEYDDTEGVLIGQCTCANDRVDYSGSYGTVGTDGWKHFCSEPTCNKYAYFLPGNCYQPDQSSEDNEWEEDTPLTPLAQGGWEELTHGIAWAKEQQTAGDSTSYKYRRKGPYTLFNVSPPVVDVPETNDLINAAYAVGGWHTAELVTYLGITNYPRRRTGFETIAEDASVGPAGDNFTRYKGIGTTEEDRTVNKGQIFRGSCDFDPYTHTVSSEHGHFQLAGKYHFDLVIPRITPGQDNTFYGGTLSFGYWDAFGTPCTALEAIYTAKIHFTENFDVVNRGVAGTTAGSLKSGLSATIVAVTVDGDYYTLHLANPVLQCRPATSDTAVEWASAGCLVAMPEVYRVNNILTAAEYGLRGPRRDSTIQVGDGCKFTDVTFGAAILDKIFEVTAVEPAAGITQKWHPDLGSTDDNAAYYAANMAQFEYPAGLPALTWITQAYSVWGCKSDTVTIKDEMGLIATAGSLVGKTVHFGDVLGYHPSTNKPALYLAHYNALDADVALTLSTHYNLHAANNDIFIKPTVTFIQDHCMYIHDIGLKMTSCMQSTSEVESVRGTIEKLLGT